MAPGFHTARLRLRPFDIADAEHLDALHGDPEVMRFINGGEAESPETIRDRSLPRLCRRYACLDAAPGFWAAEEIATATFLGWFELRPVDDDSAAVLELGYRLDRAAWGKGYATEGSRALIHRAFTTVGAERITANTMTVNTRSRAVMERCGLTLLRSFTGDWPEAIPGSEHGEVEYVLSRADWRPDPSRELLNSGEFLVRISVLTGNSPKRVAWQGRPLEAAGSRRIAESLDARAEEAHAESIQHMMN